ncbi:MAG: 4-hydroxy-tetrahydrodipicolinate reductase [Neomegalonema sp.]|nr:4-hydroxy-tetrahydrodipicolinate reductase [Neomegalonema sp.]
MMKIAILGCAGRMGRMLMQAVEANETAELSAASERLGSEWIGRDVAILLGGEARGVAVSDNLDTVFGAADAVIDFTSPTASAEHAEMAAATGTALVIGTTGFDAPQLARIAKAAQAATIVRAGNMSLGVNLLTRLVEKIAAALDDSFDIEVIEAHHNRKVDAPSGTALMLGDAAAKGRGVALSDVEDRGRDGITGARKRGDIGFSVIRGGDIVGEHEVLFAAAGERIKVSHICTDRSIFARGAVRAALWTAGRAPGEYEMVDVLGL